jgi:hypothetical protein
MKIGYYDSFGVIPSTEAVKRSIRIAKENLHWLGYELVPFSFTDAEIEDINNTFFALIMSGILGPCLNTSYSNYEKSFPQYSLVEKYFKSSLFRRFSRFVNNLCGNIRINKYY